VSHHREVVGDEDIGKAEAALQVSHEVDDLCLNRDVECRHRLVADDQLRLDRERTSDADALALPAREFVRIAAGVIGTQTHRAQQFSHPRVHVGGGLRQPMQAQRFGQQARHRHGRIERRIRILKDDLQRASSLAQRARIKRAEILPIEVDLARGRLDQPQQQPPQSRLPAPGLADDPDRFTGHHRQVHVVDGADHSAGATEEVSAGCEMTDQPLRSQQRLTVDRPVLSRGRFRPCRSIGAQPSAHAASARSLSGSSGAFRQADQCCDDSRAKAGSCRRQPASANGQRSAKRQPAM
jgi:hypothetical protein